MNIEENLPPQIGQTFYISYYDAIDLARVKAIMGICSQVVAQQKPTELYFMFASPGGEVNSGVVLYNFLRALPVEITMHNIGAIDSIANVIFMAGTKRYAAPHSTFLFHGVAMILHKDTQLSVSQINELKSSIESDQKKIAGIIQENTMLSEKEIVGFFNEGEAKDATFAKNKGIISDILKPEVPKGAPFITININ